jgi:hypothetical protein
MIQYTFEEGRDVCEGDPLDSWLFLGSSRKDDLSNYHTTVQNEWSSVSYSIDSSDHQLLYWC